MEERLTLEAVLEKRAVPADVQTVTKDAQEFADKAYLVLGYKALREEIATSEVDGPLRRLLQKLEIETLDPFLVRKYQWQVLQDLESGKAKLVGGEVERDDDEEDDDDDEEIDEETTTPRPQRTALLRLNRILKTSRYCWERIDISHFPKQIPMHVISRAIEVKQAAPQVDVLVEFVNRLPDPFILVNLDNEFFYVDAWDEPEFEGRTTARQQAKQRTKKMKKRDDSD